MEEVRDFIEKSDVCLGFLPKKGNASVKSMLKAYKLEDHYSSHLADSKHLEGLINCKGANMSGINTIAYLARLELYVPEHQWKSASPFQQGALTCFINNLEEQFS